MRFDFGDLDNPWKRQYDLNKDFTFVGLYGKDLNVAYAMGYDTDDKRLLLFVVDVTANRIGYYNFAMLLTSNNKLNQAYFKSDTEVYFVGALKKIEAHSTISEVSFSKFVGFIGTSVVS